MYPLVLLVGNVFNLCLYSFCSRVNGSLSEPNIPFGIFFPKIVSLSMPINDFYGSTIYGIPTTWFKHLQFLRVEIRSTFTTLSSWFLFIISFPLISFQSTVSLHGYFNIFNFISILLFSETFYITKYLSGLHFINSLPLSLACSIRLGACS